MEEKKKERTIRSEVTKVFLVIFGILAVVGVVSIFSAYRGANTFTTIREVHLKQFQAAETMKQKALDVIAIYYLLATDQDQNVLMGELLRYNPLVESFEQSGKLLEKSYEGESGPTKDKVLKLLKETKVVFDDLNESCRQMLFPMMRGEKADRKHLPAISEGVNKFKAKLDEIEAIVSKQLEDESNKAQSLLNFSTLVGIGVTILAIFITLALINYLMKFLSVSLLPISNLMHNMRQAVFSVDKSLNVTSPVSAYSSVVFDEDIVGKNLDTVAFGNIEKGSEAFSQHKVAMDLVFGEDEFQWSLVQDSLIRQVSKKKDDSEKILKLSYAPLIENGVIQNIMVVAEDVTEVEKLRLEGQEKQGKIEIIKSYMGLDIADLDNFLKSAYDQVNLCYQLIPKLGDELSARQSLFRTLHTLKGNARMYKLNLISESVHKAENYVVELNRRLQENEELHNIVDELKVSLREVEGILAEHCKLASSFFGIKDYYSDYAYQQLRNAVTEIENSQFNSQSETVTKLLDSAIVATSYFESEILKSSLTQFKEGSSDGKLIPSLYLNLLFEKGELRPYELEMQDFATLFAKLVELTILYELQSDASKIMKVQESFQALADKSGIETLRIEIKKLIENQENYAAGLNAMWGAFATISALDVRKQADRYGSHLAKASQDIVMNSLLSFANYEYKTILSTTLNSLEDLLITRAQFWQLTAKIFKVNPDEAVELFLGLRASRNEDELVYLLKDGSLEEWPRVLQLSQETNLRFLTMMNQDSVALKTDLLRILGTFKAKSGVPLFGATEQQTKVSSSTLNEINDLCEKLIRNTKGEGNEDLIQLSKVIQRIHESPLANLLMNMAPMAQELAGRLDKKFEIEVFGDQVYVGREYASLLRDALVHLIRNTVDHGIELPEKRVSLGKPQHGKLTFNLRNLNGKVSLEIIDDGKGIDVERLLEKAVASGFVKPEKAKEMSHAEKLNLVFLPNLSTKEEVTTISGRGVGMDAVRSIVESIGGTINLESELGKGVKIIITFDTFKRDGEGKKEITLQSMFENLKPMIQELAIDLGKSQVDYTVTGEASIAKEVIYSVRDAVIHILRNSIDHGIEEEAVRVGKNKNSFGKINVSIGSDNGKTFVTISDDGKGIDGEALVAKALELGMLKPEKAQVLTLQEKIELSFLPNLSTKEKATAISGRGVGMDAVKNILASMGGEVRLVSESGSRTSVTMIF